MKVALFVPSLRGGGAERVMVNLARGFSELGLNVDLLLAQAEGPYLSQLPPGIRVVDLGAKRVLHSLPGLVSYLRREKPKALLSALHHANVVALWARRLAGEPVHTVVSVHNPIRRASVTVRSLRSKLDPVWARLFYPWADAIVAVSQGVAEDLSQAAGLPRERIHVIHNPVVTPELLTKAEEPVEHPWFRPGAPPVVLGVGRLTEQKDFPTLIRAFGMVRKQLPARLMILGEGKGRQSLEALVRELGLQDDVCMPGFVENPYKYMKRAAVFVLSSKWEGFANVLVEAMAVGTPVVATDCPSGPAEILEAGKWGKLVPVGDPNALFQAVLEVLCAKAQRKAASERVAEFSLSRIVDQYAEILSIRV